MLFRSQNHPVEVKQFCISGCLVPLSIAKQDQILSIESIQIIEMLVQEDWLFVVGFKSSNAD